MVEPSSLMPCWRNSAVESLCVGILQFRVRRVGRLQPQPDPGDSELHQFLHACTCVIAFTEEKT